MTSLIADVNMLRTSRFQLQAQVDAGVDTTRASLEEAREALAGIEEELRKLEAQALQLPEAAHLFKRTRKKSTRPTGRTHVLSLNHGEAQVQTPTKEAGMARKSKAVQLEETLAELRRVEKLAGTTKWALEGAGAKKNPPSPERAAHLAEKLANEQAQIAELRAKRDALK